MLFATPIKMYRWAREESPDMDRIEDLYAMGVLRHRHGGEYHEGLPGVQGYGGHGPGGAHGLGQK